MSRDTPDRILDVAEHIFSAQGFAGARTASIAEAAGVNKATLHYWFRDKEGLYRAVLERTFDEVADLALSALNRADAPIAARVEDFIRGYARVLLVRPTFARMMARELMDNSARVTEILLPRALRIGPAYILAVQEGQRQGLLNPNFDARFTPLMTIAPIVLFVTIFPTMARAIRLDASEMDATFLDSMVSLFLNGLLIRPEQRADAPSAFPIGPAPGLTPSASASTNPQGETP